MRAEITAELVAEAKVQAQRKLQVLTDNCKSVGRRGSEDCTCPKPGDEDKLIANHLNFALSIMEHH